MGKTAFRTAEKRKFAVQNAEKPILDCKHGKSDVNMKRRD